MPSNEACVLVHDLMIGVDGLLQLRFVHLDIHLHNMRGAA